MPAEDRNPEEGPTAAARFGTGLGVVRRNASFS